MNKYFLEKDERANVESRHALIKQYQYLIHVINADVKGFMEFVVLKRLKLEGKNYTLSPDNEFITIEEEKHEPDTTKGK